MADYRAELARSDPVAGVCAGAGSVWGVHTAGGAVHGRDVTADVSNSESGQWNEAEGRGEEEEEFQGWDDAGGERRWCGEGYR